jgi:hypothetical protein
MGSIGHTDEARMMTPAIVAHLAFHASAQNERWKDPFGQSFALC